MPDLDHSPVTIPAGASVDLAKLEKNLERAVTETDVAKRSGIVDKAIEGAAFKPEPRAGDPDPDVEAVATEHTLAEISDNAAKVTGHGGAKADVEKGSFPAEAPAAATPATGSVHAGAGAKE